jgi:HEAT repeat protein
VLAHAFAQSGDPLALKALEDTLKDPDRGLIDHRVAAHGLAFTDLESVVPTLRQTAKEDPDQGARANAAFGLARRGDSEGMALYAAATDEAFEKRDPAAIQYLSGFALLGKKAVPVMRERLSTYEDKQAKIVLIELLKDQKDVESVPVLRKLAADSETDPDVRKAAEQALTELAK